MRPAASIAWAVAVFSTVALAQGPAAAAKGAKGATVQTSSGAVTGHAANNRTAVTEYLGIPYAAPPIGDLRFAAPQSYNSKTSFDASTYVWIPFPPS